MRRILSFRSCLRDKYKNYITREVRKASKDGIYCYQKNDKNTFSILKKYGNQQKAIEWAKMLEKNYRNRSFASHNPCTKVYELVNELTNPDYALSKI